MRFKDNCPSFFQPGEASDEGYVFNRDHESRAELRANLERRWARCRSFCGDEHFLELAKDNFNGATWQLFLLSELLERSHKLVPTASDEPDIRVMIKGKKCWIEAAAADAGTGANNVPKLRMGTINDEQIKLRLTSKIRDKAFGDQYKRWVEKGIVANDDFYVIAINGSDIPNADIAGGPVNVMEQCLFGLGQFAWQIEVPSGKMLSAGHQHQEKIEKRRDDRITEINNNFFLTPEMSHVSALIYSHLHFVNSYDRFGIDIRVVHNPLAKNKIPLGTFRFGKEIWVDKKGMLTTRDHSRLNIRWRWHLLKTWFWVQWFSIKNFKTLREIKKNKPFSDKD